MINLINMIRPIVFNKYRQNLRMWCLLTRIMDPLCVSVIWEKDAKYVLHIKVLINVQLIYPHRDPLA